MILGVPFGVHHSLYVNVQGYLTLLERATMAWDSRNVIRIAMVRARQNKETGQRDGTTLNTLQCTGRQPRHALMYDTAF